MAHDFLDHFQIGFMFAKPGTKCMSEMVARKIGQNDRLSSLTLGFHNLFSIVAVGDSLDRAVDGLGIGYISQKLAAFERAIYL